jgi:hypothetical protein
MPEDGQELPPCLVCGRHVPTFFAYFVETRGMLAYREERTYSGRFCPPCLRGAFKMVMTTLLLRGWWGVFSLFLTPMYLVFNSVEYFKVRRRIRQAYEGAPPEVGPA